MSPVDLLLAHLPALGPHPAPAELRAYAAGTLATPEQHLIEAHTLDCEHCADVLAGFSMTDAATTDQAVAGLRTRLQARLATEPARLAPPATWAWPRTTAAAALVGVVVGGIWGWQQHEAASSRFETAPAATVATAEPAREAPASSDAKIAPADAPPPPPPGAYAIAKPARTMREVAPMPNIVEAETAQGAPAGDEVAEAPPQAAPPQGDGIRAMELEVAPPATSVDKAKTRAEEPAATKDLATVASEPAADAKGRAMDKLAETKASKKADEAEPLGNVVTASASAKKSPAVALGEKMAAHPDEALPTRQSRRRARLARANELAVVVAPAPAAPVAPVIVPDRAPAAAVVEAARGAATPMPAAPAVGPMPVGGVLALREYLRREAASFTPEINALRLAGTVHVQFVVGADGKLSNLKVTCGLRPDYDAEALRLVTEGPAWQPGITAGRRAAQSMEVAVPF